MKAKRQIRWKMLILLCSIVLTLSFGFSALAAQESEDNGSFERADVITFDSRVVGNISAPGDEDYYKFSVRKSGNITIAQYTAGSTTYNGFDTTYLYLYDQNHRTVYRQDEMYGVTDETITVTPGVYFIRLTQCGIYKRKIPYSFSVTFSEGRGMYQGDDNFSSFQNARKVSFGQKVYGNLTPSGECSYYKFVLPQAGTVDVTGARTMSGNNYGIWKTSLYNARKERIDAGIDVSNKVRIGLSAGTYYLKVSAGERWSSQRYYFKLEYKKTNLWEKELNDTLDRSTLVRMNSSIYGTANSWSDVDCYYFNMPRDGKVKFIFSMDDASYVTLYTPSCNQSGGRLLYHFENSTNDKTISLKKGRYYLKVNHDYLYWGTDSNSSYHFKLQLLPEAASVKLDKSKATISLTESKTLQLTATVTGKSKKATWKSSNTAIATVSSTGLVTGKTPGTTIITASANGKTARCTVTVKRIAKVDKKRMYAQYKRIVMNNINEYGRYGSFAFYDADGDGVPELYADNTKLEDWNGELADYIVYSFASNQVKKIGALRDGIYLYWPPDGSGIVNSSNETIAVYKVTKNSVIRTEFYDSGIPGPEEQKFFKAWDKYFSEKRKIPTAWDVGTAAGCEQEFERLIAPYMK